jgi:hypothetical protein
MSIVRAVGPQRSSLLIRQRVDSWRWSGRGDDAEATLFNRTKFAEDYRTYFFRVYGNAILNDLLCR